MSTFKRTLELAAYDAVLTERPDDYYLRAKTQKQILKLKDISKEVASQVGKYSPEEVEFILTRSMEIMAEAVASGYAVHTPLCNMLPTASGTILRNELSAGVNRKKISIYASYSQGSAMSEAMTKNDLVYAPQPAVTGPQIYTVTNPLEPNAASIRRKGTVLIKGKDIKLVCDEAHADLASIIFSNVETEVSTSVPAGMVYPNQPSTLQFTLPDSIAVGDYRISVRTQFNGSGKLVKEPRIVEFEGTITIV